MYTARQPDKPCVVHLLASLQVGGLERVALDLMDGLARRGWEQVLCLSQGRGAWCERVPQSVRIVHLGARPNSPSAVQRIARIARETGADILHSLSLAVWGEAAAVRLMDSRLRHIHAFHGFFGQIPRRWEWLGRAFARGTDGFYAVGETAAEQAVNRFELDRSKIMIVPNGIKVEQFAPTDPPRASAGSTSGLTCVAVGSVKKIKRPDRFIDVARRCRSDMRFMWIGEGPTRLDMVRRVRDLGLEHRVEFAGADDGVANRLRAADVFLMTSDQEAAPLAVLEAMATGLPVVTPPVGEVGRWVNLSCGGVLVGSGQEAEYAEAIDRLAADPSERARMGQSGRAFVVEHHSTARMTDAYERLFESSCVRHAPIVGTVAIGGA